jgi:HEAT repeat protein
VVHSLLLFELFAAHPSPQPAVRQRESGLGLALLSKLGIGRDDQALLDAADDQASALLSILAQDREYVLPDIVERVAALGPQIVPRLTAMLDPGGFGWGMLRAIQAIERLARLHPGSCDAAVPGLVALLNDDQGDFVLEGASHALEAIGAPAAPVMLAHLRDDDMARQIFLTGALQQIPTESAAQAILAWLADGEPLDEAHVTTLEGIGSPSAIEPLYALWKSEPDQVLAESLLVLCQLHGVSKPELPEWRQAVEAQDAGVWQQQADIEPLLEQLLGTPVPSLAAPKGEPAAAQPRSARRPKGLSKKERQKRAAQRRGAKKKKKR